MKKLLLLLISAFVGSTIYSQSVTKLDFYLAVKQDAYLAKGVEATKMLPVLIQGNIDGIKQLTKVNGGTFKYSYGNIAAIVIPVRALPVFNSSSAVTRMEGTPERMQPLDDSSNVKNHIIEVLKGQSPLPKAYDGKGVVIGFVDTGIDYLHSDFRDSTGTRIKFYWDQNRYRDAYTPSAYNYGQAWNKAQLDAASGNLALSMDSASIIDFGHGTNVAGVAVGNGDCNGHEIGGCPKSDIIYVAYNLNVQGATMLTDAVQYIFTCADSLNEPCVVNLSLGSNDGSHDDSDLQGEMIDNMLAAKQPGRVVVAAAGNSGAPYHVHDSLIKGDTTFTWFIYDAGLGIADIPIFANEPNFKNLKFRLRCDKVQTGSFTERDTFTVYGTIKDYLGFKAFSVYNKLGQRLARVQSNGQVYGTASYSLEFQILPDSTSYDWGFEATDTAIGGTPGRYDVWDYGSRNGVVDTVGLGIKPALFPEMKKYKQPDTLMTICSSFQCSPHVITAQTYYNLKNWKDCNGNVETGSPEPGGFNYKTSRGPVRNYAHMKPDVSASGDITLAALPTWFLAMYGCNNIADSLGCHNSDGGTSLACPMVASAAGIYLEKYPNATDSNVHRCIIETAYNDVFTGPASSLPNSNWGYGKLDAFNALTLCGPTDIQVVSAPGNLFSLSAYPNPFTYSTTISYDFSAISDYSAASIIVYDMMGKAIKTITLGGNKGTILLDRTKLAPGMYFYSLMVDGSRLKTEKLEIL